MDRKKILITGATDGIGLLASKKLVNLGHYVLIHGRNQQKVKSTVTKLSEYGFADGFTADLSKISEVYHFVIKVKQKYKELDVLINNAGVLKTQRVITSDGLDTRFAVNTFAPYILAKQMLPLLRNNGRVINVASAAQASVDVNALVGKKYGLKDLEAYSQSKLAMIMFSLWMSRFIKETKTVFVSVNPGSLLGTKMVKESFNIDGKDINIGADILIYLATIENSLKMSAKYYDNDCGKYTDPHPDALDVEKCFKIVEALDAVIQEP